MCVLTRTLYGRVSTLEEISLPHDYYHAGGGMVNIIIVYIVQYFQSFFFCEKSPMQIYCGNRAV